MASYNVMLIMMNNQEKTWSKIYNEAVTKVLIIFYLLDFDFNVVINLRRWKKSIILIPCAKQGNNKVQILLASSSYNTRDEELLSCNLVSCT